MPKMIFVNVPVADVEKSVTFYETIGFIKDERFSQPGSAGACGPIRIRPRDVDD